ncbi:MAG: hypothetical protein QW597_00085 [Thermoplasmataceae archaeon]
MKAFPILIMALLVTLPAFALISSASSPVIDVVNVEYPQNVYVGQTFTVYVNNSAGFTNYSTVIYFAGDNLTGFSPTNTFENFGGTNFDASVNVTAPLQAQTIYMFVRTSAMYGHQYENFSQTFEVNVYNTVSLSAVVSNSNAFAVSNVTVTFDLNGNVYGTKTVNLQPSSSQVVSVKLFNYILSDGKYTLTVTVNNPMIKVNGNTGTSSTTFFVGTPANYNWIYYIAIGVFIFMAFVVFASGRRPNRPSRPKWRR